MTAISPSILIVDDVPANLVAMEKLLAPLGAGIVTATSGNEALARCIERDFAVVLLDVQMPEMDGYEVAALLHGEPKTAHLPIIFVTASYHDDAHRLQAYDVGAVDYIEKPVDSFVLRSKVQVFLDLFVSRRRLEVELAHSESIAAALRDSEARFREAIADAPIPIILHADNGEILLVSRSLTELTGYQPADIPTIAAWSARAFGEGAGLAADGALLTGTGKREVRRADGTTLVWDFRVGRLHPLPDGRQVMVTMAVDVTDSTRAHHQLEESAHDLALSNQELETFAYVASHDLREPLRMVTAFLGLLERKLGPALDAEASEFIGFAKEGATRMDHLIVDLLEYSRIGRLDRPNEDVDMNDLLATVVRVLGPEIDLSGAVVEIPTPLPPVRANAIEMHQLLQNLVGNAVKFHLPDQPPRVTVTCRPAAGRFHEFRVADNGIGIDSQYFERIFQVFQRLHGREQYLGTGIGLAVCRKIVERHGGRIRVESQPGAGSSFLFTLPRAGLPNHTGLAGS